MASEIKVDTISEKTSAGGVTIDGLLIKDGNISGDVALAGTTPTFTIGDAGAEDATLLFDGNAQDFHIGLDDSSDDLVIGVGSALGTTTALAIDENAGSTFSGTVTVGVDDTGKDVKLFGATSGSFLLWDESADALLLTDSTPIQIGDAQDLTLYHDGSHSYITNKTGTMKIATETSGIAVTIGHTTSETTIADNLTVTGTTTITGSLDVNNQVTINENSADVDFRVESNTKTHMLTVDGGNNLVGIGHANAMPDHGTGLHIKTADAGSVSVATGADELVLENGTSEAGCGMTILSATDAEGIINFADSGDADKGRIVYNQTNDYMAMWTNASETGRFAGYGLLLGRTSFVSSTGAVIQVNADIKSSGGGAFLSITALTSLATSCLFHNGNGEVGSIKTNSSATSFNTSSDYRLKENETAITDGITRIKQLKPYRFNFKADADKTVDGFFAHEVSPIIPEAISGEKDAMYPEVLYTADDELPEGKNIGDVKEATKINPQGIDQSKLVPVTVACLKELITKIETLEAKVAVLEG